MGKTNLLLSRQLGMFSMMNLGEGMFSVTSLVKPLEFAIKNADVKTLSTR
jgi:hypothetical protein